MRTVQDYLGKNAYPGRGLLVGATPGSKRVVAYFIMGRSENSKNRVFVREGDDLRIIAFNPAKMKDPSLVIYYPVREHQGSTIVTNGDQTDTILDHLRAGKTFEDALLTRTFEPDAPHYTPRISGLLDPNGGYKLSILKAEENDPRRGLRAFYQYDRATPGIAHLIHTYAGDGDPLPSFCGEPVAVAVMDGIDAFAESIWNALNPAFRVSLFLRFIGQDGTKETRIINANS
ncbi:MAG: IMP cyclohydrolase [Christensenellales bacterium]|jgi:IMP cyclohydrolase